MPRGTTAPLGLPIRKIPEWEVAYPWYPSSWEWGSAKEVFGGGDTVFTVWRFPPNPGEESTVETVDPGTRCEVPA